MQGEHSNQSSFFGMSYEDLIPADHLLHRLSASVDFSFVSQLVSDCYCPDNGRPSWDPLGGMDIREVKRLIGDRICLIDSVNMPFIQRGTLEQIEESCLYCLARGGAEQGEYTYTTSNCIFKGVPL